eukprot:1565285-Rhodomonas_salina.2
MTPTCQDLSRQAASACAETQKKDLCRQHLHVTTHTRVLEPGNVHARLCSASLFCQDVHETDRVCGFSDFAAWLTDLEWGFDDAREGAGDCILAAAHAISVPDIA